MSRKKALIDWSGFAGSQYVSRLSAIVRSFVVATILGPSEYGSWLALLLIYDLGTYAHFGILNGMDREIPFHLGRGDEETAWRYRDSGYTAVVFFAALLVLVLVGIDLLRWQSISMLSRVAFPIIGVAIFLQIYIFLYCNIFRSRQRISAISQSMVLQASINLVLSISLVLAIGVYGMFIALVVANFITVLFLHWRADWKFRFVFDRDMIQHLLIRGGPVLAFLFVEVLLRQVDKLVIVAHLSRADLGYYGIASTVAGMLMYITSSASFTLFPQFLSKFGKTGEVSSLARMLKEPTLAFSIFIPIFLAFVYLWIHIPVVHALPKFVPGISAMRVLVCGTLFLSIASLPSFFLITVNKTKLLLIGAAITVVAEWTITTTMVKMGFGIKGVAFGASICQFLYGTALLSFAFRLVPEGERHVVLTVVKTYLPTLYVVAVVALLFYFIPVTESTLTADISKGLLHGAILLAATSPLWIFLQKRTQVFTMAWGMITKRGDQ